MSRARFRGNKTRRPTVQTQSLWVAQVARKRSWKPRFGKSAPHGKLWWLM